MDGEQIIYLRKTQVFSQTPKIQGCIFGVDGEQKCWLPEKTMFFSNATKKQEVFLWYLTLRVRDGKGTAGGLPVADGTPEQPDLP